MKRNNDELYKSSKINNNNIHNNKKITNNNEIHNNNSFQNINRYSLQSSLLLDRSGININNKNNNNSLFLNSTTNSFMNTTSVSNISLISNNSNEGINSKARYLEEIKEFLKCFENGDFDNIDHSVLMKSPNFTSTTSILASTEEFRNISPILTSTTLNVTSPITPIHPVNKKYRMSPLKSPNNKNSNIQNNKSNSGISKLNISTTSLSSATSATSATSTTSATTINNLVFDSFKNFSIGVKIWLLHIASSIYMSLDNIVPKKEMSKVVYNLLLFVLDNDLFLNNNSNNNNSNNNSNNNNNNNINNNNTNNNNNKERLPIGSRLLTIYDILNRNRNLSSRSVNDNQILRILVGKVSSIESNEIEDSHILTLKDNTGEIVIEIGNTHFYLLNGIAFIPFFNLICISPNKRLSKLSKSNSDKETPSSLSVPMSIKSRLSLLDQSSIKVDISKSNYLEVDKIYIIYRPYEDYYEEMIRKYRSLCNQRAQYINPKDLSATRNIQIEQFIINENQPFQPIKLLNQFKDQVLNNINIYGTILSKSAIANTKNNNNTNNNNNQIVNTLFFIQIIDTLSSNENERKNSKIYLLFSGTSLKWFELLQIGTSYLFCNVGFQNSLNNTESKQNIIIINQFTKIYPIVEQSFSYLESLINNNSNQSFINNTNYNNNKNNNKIIIEYLNYNDNNKLPYTINCIVEITQELNSHYGTIGIDNNGILFLSHYRSHLFHARGFRVGTTITLFNVHPIYLDSKLLGVSMCQSSSFKFTKFDNNRLQCNVPFSKSTLLGENQSFSDLWLKYSIVNSFILSKLLLKLLKKFPNYFNSLESFKINFLGKPIYENISNVFNISKLNDYSSDNNSSNNNNINNNNNNKLKKYDHILAHEDFKCDSYIEDTVYKLKFLNLSNISKFKSDRSPIVFNSSKDYYLIGLLEVCTQGFEWGRVSLKVDSNTAIDCFVPDINEHHLNKIWKIGKFSIHFEEYQNNNVTKSINYVEFYMKDCDILAPILDKSLFYNNLPYQLLFDQFQVSILKLLNIQDNQQQQQQQQQDEKELKEQKQLLNQTHNLFILLLEKTVELGLITLTAILLIPTLPKVLIQTTLSLKINFPILQKGFCYYISGAIFNLNNNNNNNVNNNLKSNIIYNFSLTVNSILKSICLTHYLDSENFVVIPRCLRTKQFKQLGIQQISIKNKQFYRKIAKYDNDSKEFIQLLTIEDIYNGNGISQDDFVSFKGLIVSKRIEQIENQLSTTKGSHQGKPSHLIMHLVCTDPDYPSRYFLPISIDNFYCGMTVGSIIQFYFLQTKSTLNLIQENNKNINNNNNNSLENISIKSNYLCHSNRFFYYHIINQENLKDLNLFDFIQKTKLSNINKKSLDQYYRVIADIIQVEKLILSFKCSNCLCNCIACICGVKDKNQFLFNGILECEITDGTISKKLVIKKDSIISNIFNLTKDNLDKIKEFSIRNKMIFSYEMPSIERKRELEETLKSKFNNTNFNNSNDNSINNNKAIDKQDSLIGTESNSRFVAQFPKLKEIFRQIPISLELIVKKVDIDGLTLFCNQINFIDTSTESWSLINHLIKSPNNNK